MDVSLKKLIESGAHFGHQSRRWNPKMKDYIYGEQDGVHVFDLIKTKAALEEALEKIKTYVGAGRSVVLLGTKKQAKDRVKKIGEETEVYYVYERWLGGTITNFKQIKKSLRKLSDMKDKREKGEYNHLTKKEQVDIDREIQRLERFFGGLSGLESIPDLLIVIDTKREKTAVKEANEKGVEVVGLVDSNADPEMVDYPIPMNDDATKALDYVLDLIRDAIDKGKSSKRGTGSKKSANSDDIEGKGENTENSTKKKITTGKKGDKKTKPKKSKDDKDKK